MSERDEERWRNLVEQAAQRVLQIRDDVELQVLLLREQIVAEIEAEFADDPWIFNEVHDAATHRLALHVKDMAVRVVRGGE